MDDSISMPEVPKFLKVRDINRKGRQVSKVTIDLDINALHQEAREMVAQAGGKKKAKKASKAKKSKSRSAPKAKKASKAKKSKSRSAPKAKKASKAKKSKSRSAPKAKKASKAKKAPKAKKMSKSASKAKKAPKAKKSKSKSSSKKAPKAKKSKSKSSSKKAPKAKKSKSKSKSKKGSKSQRRSMPPGMIAFRELVNGIKKHVDLPGVVAINLLAKAYKTTAEKQNPNNNSVESAKLALQLFEKDFKAGKHTSAVKKARDEAEYKAKNRKPRKSKKSKKSKSDESMSDSE